MVSSSQTSWPWGEEEGSEERREEQRGEKESVEKERRMRGDGDRVLEEDGRREG